MFRRKRKISILITGRKEEKKPKFRIIKKVQHNNVEDELEDIL